MCSYCLHELPATVDEFVHWVCEDCEVKRPQNCSSLESEPIQLESRDCIIPEQVEPNTNQKSKRRKTDNLVLDSGEDVSKEVPSEQSDKVAEVKLTRSAQLAGECSSLEVNQKACHGATPIIEKTDQIPPRSSPQLDDAYNEVGLQQSESLETDIPLKKIKTKKKKKKKVSGKNFCPGESVRTLGRSSYEQPCEPYTDNNLNEHDDSTELKKNKKSGKKFSSGKSVQTLGHGSYVQPCEAYTENHLNERDDLTELEKREASNSANKNEEDKKTNKEDVSKCSIQRNGFKSPEQACEPYNEKMESTELEDKRASLSEAKIEDNGSRENTEFEVTATDNKVLEFYPMNKSNKKKRVVNPLFADVPEQEPQTHSETPTSGLSHLSNGTLESQELAQPLADPIWRLEQFCKYFVETILNVWNYTDSFPFFMDRGSFNILNKEHDAFEGMVAHLSKKACQKAYEEASLFPTLLDLEMYPKSDIWPKSFETAEPSDDNIALYFFPMHKRCSWSTLPHAVYLF